VRELEQCLHAACILADDGVITAEELPTALAAPGARPAEPPRIDIGDDPRARLVALFAEHSGNVSAVARELRTSRSQLRRLMARYGIAGKSRPDPV